MSHQPSIGAERFTYGDYLAWPEGERWELIGGVPWNMTPAPSTAHQIVVGELFFQFRTALAGHSCQAFVAPFDVRLPEEDEPDEQVTTVVQPDLSVICDRARLDERGYRGAPDLVIEVLSPATALKDQTDKVALYERSGVREYWIVHPTDRLVTIRRLAESGLFEAPRLLAAAGQVGVGIFPGLAVGFDAVFAALP